MGAVMMQRANYPVISSCEAVLWDQGELASIYILWGLRWLMMSMWEL